MRSGLGAFGWGLGDFHGSFLGSEAGFSSSEALGYLAGLSYQQT